jgi:hypothetical protein
MGHTCLQTMPAQAHNRYDRLHAKLKAVHILPSLLEAALKSLMWEAAGLQRTAAIAPVHLSSAAQLCGMTS